MRNLQMEAAIWYLFTSEEFYEAAARECDEIVEWFGRLAVSRGVANFGRNNQIYDKFKGRARDFRRGAELAALGDYEFIWDKSGYIGGDVRGMLEQPLHSWMTEAEYQEFDGVKISRLLKYSSQITSALQNAFTGAITFFEPDPECPHRRDDDDAFPGDRIVEVYEDNISWYGDRDPSFWKLPDPLPHYEVDKSITCTTGDEVPWTGVWYPSTGLEKHSLTFAIKGNRMQPAYRVIKTAEELRTEEQMFPWPQTVALSTSWHPVVVSRRSFEADDELWAKAGEMCPKPGLWRPTDPGASARIFNAGETMAQSNSPYGITVWRWVADR